VAERPVSKPVKYPSTVAFVALQTMQEVRMGYSEIRNSRLERRPKEVEPFELFICGHYNWLPINFGKYRGLNLPVLFFTDPGYFYWGVENELFFGRVGHQAIIVAARARHIRPPRSRPDNWEFVIKIGSDGKLAALAVSRVPQKPILKSRRIKRFKHLDVSIIRQFGKNSRAAADAILELLRQEFFDGNDPTDRGGRCESFFENDEHFALTCRDLHRLSR
jgi:hypothetical protein